MPNLHRCLLLFPNTKYLSLPTLFLPSVQPFATLYTLTTSGLITIVGLKKNRRSNLMNKMCTSRPSVEGLGLSCLELMMLFAKKEVLDRGGRPAINEENCSVCS
ncbi:hypothetical protein ACSBR1_003996 [Camellia fascicularis]